MSAAPTHPAPSLSDRLGVIIAGLRRDLAFRAAKDRALAPLVVLLWNRLSRVLARVAAVAARRSTDAPSAPVARRRRVAKSASPRDPLPRHFGWLVRRVPECAVHGEYLRILLADPDVQEMIAATPQLRPLLRPLWRMLRTEPAPEVLRTPAPPRPPSPLRPRVRRRRNTARVPAKPRGIPLPRRSLKPA